MLDTTALATPPSRTPLGSASGKAVPYDVRLPEPNTLYQHYKGGLFRIECLCSIKATDSLAVLYKAMDPHARQDLWMRPLEDFTFTVLGRPRFAKVPTYTDEALLAYTAQTKIPSDIVSEVLSRYEEPSRFFHTPDHLYQMFRLAASLNLSLSCEQVLALLFHDVVYVSGAGTGVNEKLSTLVLKDYGPRLQALEADLDLAADIILDTAAHKPSSKESAVVLDLDLSSLAGTPLEFAVSNELIWLENRHLIEAENRRMDFDTRRLNFLMSLADQDVLFSSTELTHLNEVAYDNIDSLRQEWLQQYSA